MKKVESRVLVPFRDREHPRATVYRAVMIVLFIRVGSLDQAKSKLLSHYINITIDLPCIDVTYY